MRLLLLLAGLLLATSAAEARVHHPYRGHRIVPPASAPLDTFTQPAAAYGMRKLRSAYSGPAIRLRRASDAGLAEIGFVGFVPGLGSPVDVAAATSHCAATTCFVAVWYDQSGNGRHAAQAGTGSQPAFIFNCLVGLPCARVSTAIYYLEGAAVSWSSTVTTLSAVGMRSVGTGACWLVEKGGNNTLGVNAVANQWRLTDGVATARDAVASDSVWHAGLGIIDGAASTLGIDGAEVVGTVTGTAGTTQPLLMRDPSGATCSGVEAIFWDGYAMPPAERTALQQNQKSFWGTP